MTKRIVVCGGGSAGCVMAARLSENAENDMTLIEAGPDYPDISVTAAADVRNAYSFGFTSHDWGYEAEDHIPEAADAPTFAIVEQGVLPVLRGKVMGGSSSVNATNALRPTKADFDRWVGLGADRWSWGEVLPFLTRLESDPAGGPLHGDSGPVPIRRFSPGEGQRPVMSAFVQACREQGHPVIEDLNGSSQRGAGPVPLNQRDGIRQSSALTHLAGARGRPNLRIIDRTDVDRIEFDGTQARAVHLTSGERLPADLVVLSAGSIGSPSILMRSGIGPRALLDALGIPMVSELDGVGQKLSDHPLVYLTYEADESAIGDLLPPLQAILAFSSGGPASDTEVDLHAIPFTLVPGQILVAVGLVRPLSLGSVEIRSQAPHDPPRVRLNLLHHPEDLRRLVAGVAAIRTLMHSNALAKYVVKELWPGPGVTTLGDLTEAVLGAKNTYAHAAGTCSMGDRGLPWAVVDQDCAVHGVRGLHVVDASVMPSIPSVPTNLTTMLIAERCAAILEDL